MSPARIMLWVTCLAEAFLGIPLLGGAFIIAMGWTPLWVMFFLHIVTLVLCLRDRKSFVGSGAGIATSLIGWIPIVGMIMHWITALILLVLAIQPDRANRDGYIPPPPPPQRW
ncbi:hypothetical protein [Paenibacillus tarimensis]|uniref:hypothetical protein n=1 Tax=Paenibacillus tarimensis TaxID=416012 RepID=UPI001F28336A|nr:hypothetical protein [Paenibacillus tarimensis]MCF2946305.1 hypothetical protein [Paenibacillus tarimensis]